MQLLKKCIAHVSIFKVSGDLTTNCDEEYVSQPDSKVYFMRHLSFTPAEGWHCFWLGYRPVFFTREVKQGEWFFGESLYLKCLGWDISILQSIIHEARITYKDRDRNKTMSTEGN